MRITGRKLNDTCVNYTEEALQGLEITRGHGIPKSAIAKTQKVSITNTMDCAWVGVIRMEVVRPAGNPRFFLPGFMYGRNTGEAPNFGRKEFPRIRVKDCVRPESNDWMVRSDRLATPLALVFDEDHVFGISATPYEKTEQALLMNGFTCGLTDEEAYVGITLGYENAPWLFIQTATVYERAVMSSDNCVRIETGETLEVELCLYDYRAEQTTGIYEAMKACYEEYHEEPRRIAGMDVSKATALLAGAVSKDAWIKEDRMYSGFVFDTENGDTYNKLGSLSWTNGLSVAVPMLLAAQHLGDDKMRQEALTCIDYIIGHCMNPASGLPYDAVEDGKWSIHGWWYDGMRTAGHSSYLVGQAVYYLLRAYEYEKKNKNVVHEEYLTFLTPIVDRINQELNGEYEYPFVYSEQNGAGLAYDSFGGCWCLAATAYAAVVTGDVRHLTSMQESEKHYYDAYVSKAECYGAPIDTDKAIDSEGILAYIRAVKYLYLITGDDCYLDHMRDAIYYECTFKFSYNTPIMIPPLSTIGWSCTGGSITSTANPHIHPMSSTIVDELLFYIEKRKDPYVESRLRDTILWGLQTFNTYDKEYGYGRIGWMSERFCYSQGLVTQKYADGSPASTWFALMPWASASILDGFCGELYSNTLLQSL